MNRKLFLTTIGAASAGLAGMPSLIVHGMNDDSVLKRIEMNRNRFKREAEIMSIYEIEIPDKRIGQFEKWELRFQLDASYENPYDPDDICVEGHFTMPSGKKVVVPAFFYVPCEPKNGLSQMTMGVEYIRKGKEEWRLRFGGHETGYHTLVLEAKEKNGRKVNSDKIGFEIVESKRPGYVKVSKTNPLYFENSKDKSLFWGVGTNIAWTRNGSYEYYFEKAKGNMNATRVWLCHWAWLEWTPYMNQPLTNWSDYSGAGYYNQMIADTLDRIFNLAEAQNLRIMLVTDNNDEHFNNNNNSAGEWPGNPYNRVNGGPCTTPGDVFTIPEAKEYYRKRLRYIVARWGYSDCLWAINSWNDYSNPDQAKVDWISEMRNHVHNLVDGWRPLIYGSNFRYDATKVTDYAQAGVELVPDKPNVTQEGYHSQSDDWFKNSVLEQTWRGLARGQAAWMVWPHVQVDRTDSWEVFRPAMNFASTQNLNNKGWSAAKFRVRDVRIDYEKNHELLEFVSLNAYGDIPEWGMRSTKNRFEVDLNAAGGQWLEGFSRTLYGTNQKAWRNPPRFVVNLPAAGNVIVDFSEIGSGSHNVIIKVNERLVNSHTFKGGRRYLSDNEARITAELPAGPVEIVIDTLGSDWVRLRSVYISWQMQKPTQMIEIQGRTHSHGGFLYIQNKTYNRNYQEVLRRNPVSLHELSLDVENLMPGQYWMKILHPETGATVRSEMVYTNENVLPLNLTELQQASVLSFEMIE
jgi:hypothetical protein